MILALAIVGVGILGMLLWNSWGRIEEEPSYRSEHAIQRVTLTSGVDFSHERRISWRCGDSVCPAEVLVSRIGERGDTLRPKRLQPTHEVVTTSGGQAVYYHVQLDSLQPGMRYVYRLRVAGAKDCRGSFVLPDEERRTSFFYLGDLRDNPTELTRRLFDYLRSSPLASDFYALSGGILSGQTDRAWQDFYHSLDGVSSSVPMILAPGLGEAQRSGWSHILDGRWRAQLGYPMNGPESLSLAHYYIDFPLFRLVILDTTDLLGLGAINSTRSWLSSVLHEAKQPWRIVLCHHAVDRVEEGKKNLIMHYFIKDELIEAGADLVLQGNDHSYARGTLRSPQGDTIPPLFVVSSASVRHHRNSFNPCYDRLGSGLLLYQHITVEPDKLTYASYRFPKDRTESLEKCRYDSVVLRRTAGDSIRLEDLARAWPERFDYDAFSHDSRGRKKAAQYAKEVRDRASHRASKK